MSPGGVSVVGLVVSTRSGWIGTRVGARMRAGGYNEGSRGGEAALGGVSRGLGCSSGNGAWRLGLNCPGCKSYSGSWSSHDGKLR